MAQSATVIFTAFMRVNCANFIRNDYGIWEWGRCWQPFLKEEKDTVALMQKNVLQNLKYGGYIIGNKI